MNPETAVALSGVWKTYRLRERGTSPREVLARIVNPRFRTVEALRGIDLAIARGEIVAIAGPNGAGKSTTVKLLSGLLAPDQGTVVALGCDPVRSAIRMSLRMLARMSATNSTRSSSDALASNCAPARTYFVIDPKFARAGKM